MEINEAILIHYQGGIAFGVIRKQIVTKDENGESTVFICEIYRQLLDGEKVIVTPVLQDVPEAQALPMHLFSQYGRAKTFWESSTGYQWAKKRVDELDALKLALEVARRAPVAVLPPTRELDEDIPL